MLRWRTMKDFEYTLLTYVVVFFTVKSFNQGKKYLQKKIVSGSSSEFIAEFSFTVSGLKGISSKFGVI